MITDRHAVKRLRQGVLKDMVAKEDGPKQFWAMMDTQFPTRPDVTDPPIDESTILKNQSERDNFLAYFVRPTYRSKEDDIVQTLISDKAASARDKAALLIDKSMMLGVQRSLRYGLPTSRFFFSFKSQETQDKNHFMKELAQIPAEQRLDVLTSLNQILGTRVFGRVFKEVLESPKKSVLPQFNFNAKLTELLGPEAMNKFTSFVQEASGLPPSLRTKSNRIEFSYVVRDSMADANTITKKYYKQDAIQLDKIDALTVFEQLEIDDTDYD